MPRVARHRALMVATVVVIAVLVVAVTATVIGVMLLRTTGRVDTDWFGDTAAWVVTQRHPHLRIR